MMPERNTSFKLGVLLVLIALTGLLSSSGPEALAQSGGTIGYGAKVTGSFAADTPRATYGFPGSEGDWIAASAEPLAGTLDLQLELIGPDGRLLDTAVQNTLAGDSLGAALTAMLPETGVYLLRLSAQGDGAGDFLLTLLGRAARESTPLGFGQPVEVNVQSDAAPQFFTFEAVDCPTTLVVTNLSEGEPFTFPFAVRLLDQRGQYVPFQRGGEQLEDWVTVSPRSGRYEVEVTASDPLAAGSVRLLVTCAGEAPGCVAGSAAIQGVPGVTPAICLPCPDPDRPPDEGGCPELNFAARQAEDNPLHITTNWDPMPGADGYVVQVNGLNVDDSEVYLTHAHWTPGDPTSLAWTLPEGYAGFRFILRVLVGDTVICTADTSVFLPARQLVCPRLNLTSAILDPLTRAVRWTWTPVPEAEGYETQLSIIRGDSLVALLDAARHEASEAALEAAYPDAEPGDIYRLRLSMIVDGMAVCPEEAEVVFDQVPPGQQPFCAVVTDQANITAHLGPGRDRAVFAWLTPGAHYPVTGQAYDAAGNLWWQVDKTLFAGHEAAESLWVLASEVLALGNCNVVPPVEPRPVIPAEPVQPAEPGTWLPCGSCDTCGHPANECVTSPEGQCLWDPTFCANAPVPGGEPGGTTCFAIGAAVDPSGCPYSGGAAMIDVASNCEGGLYLPGTAMYAHAVAVDPKCTVQSWSGCGVSGGGSSISFTATGSCTVVAHMSY